MKNKLIAAGVKHLKAYGYPECTKENIITDAIYKEFFAEMLKGTKGNDSRVDAVIDSILKEIYP